VGRGEKYAGGGGCGRGGEYGGRLPSPPPPPDREMYSGRLPPPWLPLPSCGVYSGGALCGRLVLSAEEEEEEEE